MLRRPLALLTACALLLGAAHAPRNAHAHKSKPQPPPIALVLNGQRLAVDPAPINYQRHVIVPVRRILQALGLDFDRENGRVVTHVGANTVQVTGGVEIKNTLYAPLRFFTEALGAQASYSRQTNSVEIVSTLIGRSGNGITQVGGGIEESGTLSMLDLASEPPTLTLTHNASVRTLHIRRDASVIIQDVSTGTSNAGVLEDVHAGDFAQVRLDRAGNVKQIIDGYGSLAGRVAGSGSGTIVLDDGHVIAPSRSSTVTLNGSNVGIDSLKVGDQVMVRYNIDSSEVREVIATRPSTGSPPPDTGVKISSITFAPQRPLRKGDTLQVTLQGTPGGHVAHYDIGAYVRNLGLRETQPGIYTGEYTIKRNINVTQVPLLGHLHVGPADAPVAESTATLSISTEPPAITDFAPESGDEVNDPHAAIYATFGAGAVPVNVSSERIVVNNHDVTASATRSPRYIEYVPAFTLSGQVSVSVQVSDIAGNRTTKRWTFTVKP